MNSQLSTSNEGEQQFNFDQWIMQNELQPVKQLLSKHNAVTSSALRLGSTAFQSLMSDPQLFSNAHMIPKIMNAVDQLSVSHNSLIKIIVSEDEAQVIDAIQQNLKILNETEIELSTFKEEHPQSIERIKNDKLKKVELAKMKINKTFDDLCDAFNKRRKSVLNQIDSMKYGVNDDDEKEIDIFSLCTQNIETSRTFLKENEKKYNELTSTNKNRSERKLKIVNIGKEVSGSFSKTHNTLKNKMNIIDEQIKKNNALHVNIDFCVKDNKYKYMIKQINKIGKIINKTSIQNKIINDNDESDDDETKIKTLQKKLEQKTNEYKQCISNEQQTLIKLKQSISFSMDNECRWFKSEDDEKKENPIYIIINKETKTNVSANLLLLSPPITNIDDICKYNQYLLIKMKGFFKYKTVWYHTAGLEKYHPREPTRDHPGFLTGHVRREYSCCAGANRSNGCAVIYPCCKKEHGTSTGCSQRYTCCGHDYKKSKGCEQKKIIPK